MKILVFPVKNVQVEDSAIGKVEFVKLVISPVKNVTKLQPLVSSLAKKE